MLKEYFATLGLDTLKDSLINRLSERFSQTKLRNCLEDFFERQGTINLSVLPEEELDFEGLIDYLRTALLSECKTSVLGNRAARRRAERTIRTRARAYSKSKTHIAANRAEQLAMQVVSILKAFYMQNCSEENQFIAAQISEDFETQLTEQTAEIKNSIDRLADMQMMSIDRNVELIRNGDFDQVEANFAAINGAIKTQEHCVPGYAYEARSFDQKLKIVSVPQSEEALQKYPPMFKVECHASIGGKPLKELSIEAFEYSERHQIPIEIEIINAEKFLGTFLDPRQHEAEALVGRKMIHTPKPFPPATPCQLRINGNTVYEYIELRAKEIKNDGSIVLSNDEQVNCEINLSIIANPATLRVTFMIQPRDTTTKALLKLRYFYREVCSQAEVSVYNLPAKETMLSGIINNFQYEGGISALEEEITFLEKVADLDRYFEQEIIFPEQSTPKDLNALEYLVSLIRGESVTRNWSVLSENLVCSDDVRSKISRAIAASQGDEPYALGFQGPASVMLWNIEYNIPIIRIYRNAKLKNPDKVIGLLEYLEDGDNLPVTFIPAGGSDSAEFVDSLDIQDNQDDTK